MHDSRRHDEMMAEGMIHEDHSAIANLPQMVMIKEYPRPHDYEPEVYLDDSSRGIDRQRSEDYHKMKKHLRPKKV